MKVVNQVQKATNTFLASTVGISILLIIAAAAFGAWKPKAHVVKQSREAFMDCSMSATCALN